MDPYFMQGFHERIQKLLPGIEPAQAEKLAQLGLAGIENTEAPAADPAAPDASEAVPAALDGGGDDDAAKVLQLLEQMPEEKRVALLQQLLAEQTGGGEPQAMEGAVAAPAPKDEVPAHLMG